MQVQIKCKGSFATSLESLEVIQSDLKELSEENYNKLKSQILELGFSAPFFVWKHDGKNKLCDGTQRSRALICMKEEGITMPEEFPCVEIEAKNLTEAKKKILAISSNYGTMTTLGLESFMQDIDMDLKEMAGSFTFDAIKFEDLAEVEEADMPNLGSGDKEPFQQMTFTLHDSQVESIKAAIETVKKDHDTKTCENENSNGNAIAMICELFITLNGADRE